MREVASRIFNPFVPHAFFCLEPLHEIIDIQVSLPTNAVLGITNDYGASQTS